MSLIFAYKAHRRSTERSAHVYWCECKEQFNSVCEWKEAPDLIIELKHRSKCLEGSQELARWTLVRGLRSDSLYHISRICFYLFINLSSNGCRRFFLISSKCIDGVFGRVMDLLSERQIGLELPARSPVPMPAELKQQGCKKIADDLKLHICSWNGTSNYR